MGSDSEVNRLEQPFIAVQEPRIELDPVQDSGLFTGIQIKQAGFLNSIIVSFMFREHDSLLPGGYVGVAGCLAAYRLPHYSVGSIAYKTVD